jgi:hypothetical protein
VTFTKEPTSHNHHRRNQSNTKRASLSISPTCLYCFTTCHRRNPFIPYRNQFVNKMRVFAVASLIAFFACSTSGFSAPTRASQFSTSLSAAATAEGGTKVNAAAVRKSLSRLTADNFDSTLKQIEPFLTNESGQTFYVKSMQRIKVQAKHLSVAVPAGYAKEAKSTSKRREKQASFIQAKIDAEVAAAEAAAAEVAAAAEAAASEAAAPAEDAPAAE